MDAQTYAAAQLIRQAAAQLRAAMGELARRGNSDWTDEDYALYNRRCDIMGPAKLDALALELENEAARDDAIARRAIENASYALSPNQGERPDPTVAGMWLRTTFPSDHPSYVPPDHPLLAGTDFAGRDG